MLETNSVIFLVILVVIIYMLYKTYYPNMKKTMSCPHKQQMRSKSMPREYMANKEPQAGDYKEYIVESGLESSIIDSHQNFVDEMQSRTSGASAQSVMSHDDAIVPHWGLRRRTEAVAVDPNSREVPSQTNDQLRDIGRRGAATTLF